MATPDWKDQGVHRGTKIRVALWLLQEVGVGNAFTKSALRSAFPGVEQVDRRMRDLRAHGWRIATNKEDASLTPNELRFVEAGEEVWKPGRGAGPRPPSSKQRKATFAHDAYMCVTCGIAGGETYVDSRFETAQLSVSARSTAVGGETVTQYVTECKRCQAGSSAVAAPTLARVLADLDALSDADRAALASWIARGRRDLRPVDQAWTDYRRLPAEARATVASYLEAK